MIPVELYDDQIKLNADARALMLGGYKSVLIQGATGFGKSRCAAAQIQTALLKGKKAAFIVPFRELIYQMGEQFDKFEIPHSFVADKYPFNPHAALHICTVGSLVNRLQLIRPDVVFFDEIHRGGPTVDRMMKYYKALGIYIVGLSATPNRFDGRGLGCWFEAMAQGPQIAELIARKRLSEFRLFGPESPDFSKMRRSQGNYVVADMAARMEADTALIGRAVDAYKKNAAGKRNVTFCYSRHHGQRVNEQFRAGGVPSAYVDGETPDPERRRIFRALASKELLNVCSVKLITTGFDLSSAAGMECTVESMTDLQPTLSLPEQMQKWGRTLRAKDFPAIINDHVGNAFDHKGEAKHGMPDMPREWSLLSEANNKVSGRAVPCRQCQSCGFWSYPLPTCKNCGFVFPNDGAREVAEFEGELVEITPEMARAAEVKKKQKRQRQGMAKTPEELLTVLMEEGVRNPVFRAYKILGGRGDKTGLQLLNEIYYRLKKAGLKK